MKKPGINAAALVWLVLCCWLLAMAGCRVPAAHFDGPEQTQTRFHGIRLARQIVADSSVQLACHPLRSGAELVIEPALHLCTIGRGAIGKRIILPWRRTLPQVQSHGLLDAEELEKELERTTGSPAQPARVRLLVDGQEALAALDQLIDQATSQIDVLMFQWDDDAVGAGIAEHLAAKAGPNLRVRILVDGAGNLVFGEPGRRPAEDVNRVVCRLAQKPYVEVLRTRDPFGHFDHRKLVLVDGQTAWTGGRNFTHKAFLNHDLSFVLQGPLVAELEQRFEQFWQGQGGNGVEDGRWRIENRESRIEVQGSRIDETGEDPSSILDLRSSILHPPSYIQCQARLLGTEPLDHQIEKTLYHVVDRARDHLYLENFILSDSFLVYKLACARRRGVDVRVVMTFSCSPAAVNRGNRVTANRLLREGIRVYIYPTMTHAKAASADGCWAYIGTGNFDSQSLRYNRELGLGAAGPLVQEVEQCLFLPDFNPEWELREPLPLSLRDYVAEWISNCFF